MKLFILSLVFYTVVISVADRAILREWSSFMKKFHKRYVSKDEEILRSFIFQSNFKKIKKYNMQYKAGLRTFMKGINEMSDLRLEEAKALRSCYIRGPKPKGVEYKSFNATPLPSSVDWRERGAVTDVKNQMKCRACYAFSAIGAIEAQHQMKTGQLVSLSEQFAVDCTWGTFNRGCQGGQAWEVFHSISNYPGVPTEDSYEYACYDRGCNTVKGVIGASISGYIFVNSEGTKEQVTKNLMEAVADAGPISVPIIAGEDFMYYKTGVYDCTDVGQTSHAVLIVGYKTIDDKPVWIVKNSWGASWGDQGYIYVSTNKTSRCGFFESMVYPVMDYSKPRYLPD